MKHLVIAIASATLLLGSTASAQQTRDEKVRQDREQLKDDTAWYYDDLEKGLEAAAAANKPLMVVLRCIP